MKTLTKVVIFAIVAATMLLCNGYVVQKKVAQTRASYDLAVQGRILQTEKETFNRLELTTLADSSIQPERHWDSLQKWVSLGSILRFVGYSCVVMILITLSLAGDRLWANDAQR